MSQINLDTSPYFDDFDANKDYYKVLFKPGFPVQARELTTLQSILQNQISKFGEHFFKEGSMVIPGAITYNPKYDAVILKKQQSGVDISLYLDQLVGKTISGQNTGVRAKVIDFLLPPSEGISNPTIYVTYLDSGNTTDTDTFDVDEPITLEQAVTYGNTTITSGSIFATTVSVDATAVGSAASIVDGIYFIRGTFVQVQADSIVLEPYVNIPSYRVGLQVIEKIVTAGQDNSLYDNAKGFNNFSAPGADRLQIKTALIKKPIDDTNDTDFIELLRVKNGEVKKLEEDSDYNIIKDYLAKRTYDESGDYTVNGLKISLAESLKDGEGNGGVYQANQTTDQGAVPSEDLAVVKVSSGKAYVRGYDISNPGTVNLDVTKPRTTEEIESTRVPFEMGSKFVVNNVYSSPVIGLDFNDNVVSFFNERKDGLTTQGELIGQGRVYNFSLEDAPYTGDSTPWELYLFDVQLYTVITLNSNPGSQASKPARIKGNSSSAKGYVTNKTGSTLTLTQVSGEFQRGETVTIDGTQYTIESLTTYRPSDIKSIGQGAFSCDTKLYPRIPNGFTASDNFTIDNGQVRCPGRLFNDFKVGDIVSYQKSNTSTLTYNVVTGISGAEDLITLGEVNSIIGVNDGTISGGVVNSPLRLVESSILNQENSFLYAVVEEKNLASANLSNSNLLFSKQITSETTNAQGRLTANSSSLGVTGAQFVAFDQERYSVVYSDGTIAQINSNSVEVTGSTITINNLIPNQSNITLNATGVKLSIKSKTKINTRSTEVTVERTATRSNKEYDLTFSKFYGTRVDDEEICLNYPDVNKVVAVYESLDSGTPVLDVMVFANGLDLDTNTVKGETIVGTDSGAKARLVSTPTSSTVRIVYLTQNKFAIGEEVTFLESGIITNLQQFQPGNYNDITNRFTLDKGQRQEFYDYSRIVRNKRVSPPNKKLLIVIDHFTVPTNDKGDFYTANSYSEDDFGSLVPMLANDTLRASDTLDFRPRVPVFTDTNTSPFFYDERNFADAGSTVPLVTAPNEGISLGYNFYVGRKDRVVLDPQGTFRVIPGAPATDPVLPTGASGSMELAQIVYPPYVYDVNDIQIINIDNKRFTMRDIGAIEKRVENLEEITTLSLLERETESLQVLDADGNNRFKSGFFADDFKTTEFVDYTNPDTQIDISTGAEALVCFSEFFTIPLRLQLQEGVDPNGVSLDQDVPLVDANTRKTGDLVTLDYVEVEWLKQPLASRVENVNPFNVILYDGSVSLNPRNDDFVVTRNAGNRRINVFGDADEFTREFVTDIENAQFMRERNVAFSANGIKPHTRFYTFFDGTSGIDVIPKLIQVNLRSGAFQIGETVRGFNGETQIFSARVVAPNHKTGDANSASRTFTTSPYDRNLTLPDTYSASTDIVNIDIHSLADISDDRFGGLIGSDTRLVGSSSGAVADVNGIRLVSDTFGELFGAVFFRDPYATPTPAFRVETGIRTFRLSSSPTNEVPTLGTTVISFAETTYESRGTVQNIQTEQVTIRDLPPPPPPVIIDNTVTNNFTTVIDRTVTNVIDRTVTVNNNVTEVVERTVERVEIRDRPVEWEDDDPLAQTFRVDETGAFLTAVDIFMATKSETDNLTVQIRPTTLATPENFLLQDFAEVILSPDQVNVSDDGSVPTRVVFPSPIYLEPEITYSLVLLAPTTNDYTAYIARMGEADILGSTQGGGDVIISQQYLNGSLFKSQNGSIWTASQFEDLKFTLYKASFTKEPATVFLNNPPLGRQTRLSNNPVTTLPRKIKVPVADNQFGFSVGDRIASTNPSAPNTGLVYGTVEAVGAAVSTLLITEGGSGYVDGSYTNVATFNKTANGSDLTVDVTVTGGTIVGVTINASGSGYKPGDTFELDVSTMQGSGGDCVITIDTVVADVDTLYLTDVLGQFMVNGDEINTVATNGDLTATGVLIDDTNIVFDPMYDGNIFVLDIPVHSMESDSNKIDIFGLLPDTVGTELLEPIDTSSNELVVADPTLFETFEGQETVTGYAYVGGEVIEFLRNQNGSLSITDRGVDDTAILIHDQGARVFKYELSGVSLTRINTTLDLPTDSALGNTRDMDTLPLAFDRGTRGSGPNMLNFNQEQEAGGSSARSSQNFQFNRMLPSIGLLTPGTTTNINSTVRTVSGTSSGGSEESFVDQGFVPLDVNAFNRYLTPRLVASLVNENEYLNDIPQNKSLTIALTFSTTDQNLSPVIDMKQANAVLARTALNKPVEDYATDGRVNLIVGDPHDSIYISERVDLTNPATSLEVILSAYRDESADFRVLYRLFGPETQGSTEPTWVLYPGYDNLLDTDGDGVGDRVIDPSANSGLPNQQVRPSEIGEVLEYRYSADQLPEFAGFQIKIVFSGTNEARSAFLRDIRAIALA